MQDFTSDSTLLKLYSHEHFIAILNTRNNLSVLEQELLRRLESFESQETIEEVSARVEKSFESAMEQSDFRANFIRDTQDFMNKTSWRYNETKELVKYFNINLENSQVEL